MPPPLHRKDALRVLTGPRRNKACFLPIALTEGKSNPSVFFPASPSAQKAAPRLLFALNCVYNSTRLFSQFNKDSSRLAGTMPSAFFVAAAAIFSLHLPPASGRRCCQLFAGLSLRQNFPCISFFCIFRKAQKPRPAPSGILSVLHVAAAQSFAALCLTIIC